jgi:hypothetical protein
MQIGRSEPDNFRTVRRLGQHVPIAVKHVAEAHAVAIGQTSGTNDMACEVNGLVAVRQDRIHANPVSILDLEIVDRIPVSLLALCAVIVQRHRYALMVGVDAVNPDVAERSCRGKSARVLDN